MSIPSIRDRVVQGALKLILLWLSKLMLKASGKQGVPQGSVISPLLSNIYLNEVDKMLERAKEVTQYREYALETYNHGNS